MARSKKNRRKCKAKTSRNVRNLPLDEARRMDYFRWLMSQTPNS